MATPTEDVNSYVFIKFHLALHAVVSLAKSLLMMGKNARTLSKTVRVFWRQSGEFRVNSGDFRGNLVSDGVFDWNPS